MVGGYFTERAGGQTSRARRRRALGAWCAAQGCVRVLLHIDERILCYFVWSPCRRLSVCVSQSVSLSRCVLHVDACRGVSREHGLPGPLILVDEDKFLAELLDVIFDLLELRFKFLLAFLFGRRV